jgi:hypothetical protein
VAERGQLRLVASSEHGELELGTALLRRFLGVSTGETLELAFFVEGRISVAYATSHAEHVRLLYQGQRLRGFNGAYQLVNGPIDTALLHRYPLNQIVRARNGRAGDRDVNLRRAVYIDIDPIRPKGISATDAEKRAAMDVRDRVEEFLARELGEPAALGRGDSGNGSFILIAVEQPCLAILDRASRVQRFLRLLAREFNTEHVQIDTSVGNTARLMPAPGTWKRKGENTRERPHRRVYFSCRPTVRPVPFEAIVG